MKRGLGYFFATFLVLMIAVIAIVLIWVSFSPSVYEPSAQLETGLFTINFEIIPTSVKVGNLYVGFSLKRNAGEGDVSGFRVSLEDVDGNIELFPKGGGVYEFQTKDFDLFYESLGELYKIAVFPVLINDAGNEIQSRHSFDYFFTGNEYGIVCGDNLVDGGEECDGGVGSLECGDFAGYIPGQGTLSCGVDCMFDFSSCILESNSSSIEVSCGQIINLPGNYNFESDIDFSSGTGACLTIATNDVIIDGGGHTITGPSQGEDTGLFASGVDNVTISNITLEDFSYGIRLDSVVDFQAYNVSVLGSSWPFDLSNSDMSYIANSSFSGNTGIQLLSGSSANIFENNVISGNPGIYLTSGSNDNIFQDNDVCNSASSFICLGSALGTMGTGNVMNSVFRCPDGWPAPGLHYNSCV